MNVPKWTNQSINIQTLCDYVTNKSYDIEPEHQRNVVHDVFWKQSLIKSVFTNGLIPTTYWHIVTDENGRCMHENLDGKQRISTLIEYKNNKFKYNGQYYDGLSVSLQNYYNMFTINLGVCDRELNEEEKHEIFEKLQIVKKTSLGEVLNSTYNNELKNNILSYIEKCNENVNTKKKLFDDNNRFGYLEIIGWSLYFYNNMLNNKIDNTLEQDKIIDFWNKFDIHLERNKNTFNTYKIYFNKFINIFINNNIPYIKKKTTLIPLFYIIIKHNTVSEINLSKYISNNIIDIKNILKIKVNASHSACKERIDLINKHIENNSLST